MWSWELGRLLRHNSYFLLFFSFFSNRFSWIGPTTIEVVAVVVVIEVEAAAPIIGVVVVEAGEFVFPSEAPASFSGLFFLTIL
jgi:hypothetical protein